jgi:hypothetical protein
MWCLAKTPAEWRYVRRLFVAMSVYVLAVFISTWTFHHRHPQGIPACLLASLPALPIFAVIAIFGIYLSEEKDEFVRMVMVQSSLLATAIVLAFSTFIGFLQVYNVAAQSVPMYSLFVVWFMAFGIVQPLVRRRYQ